MGTKSDWTSVVHREWMAEALLEMFVERDPYGIG